MTPPDPVLTRFRAALDAAHDRIERVVLFGSRARGGDFRADPDCGVAVSLKRFSSFGREIGPWR